MDNEIKKSILCPKAEPQVRNELPAKRNHTLEDNSQLQWQILVIYPSHNWPELQINLLNLLVILEANH